MIDRVLRFIGVDSRHFILDLSRQPGQLQANERENAHQNMGFDAFDFWAEDWPQPQIGLAGAERGLGLLKLQVPFPESARIAVGVIGPQ